ncbi:MAG: hypothetical protein RLZZ553_1260 [Verrucomicrobiota bacterium]|jgi:hypothetical protein
MTSCPFVVFSGIGGWVIGGKTDEQSRKQIEFRAPFGVRRQDSVATDHSHSMLAGGFVEIS